jgi:cytidylate kinase
MNGVDRGADQSRPGAPMVIGLDGPAGSGKSTVARAVAQRLGIEHLDTGAMYRAVAWACRERHVDPTDVSAMTAVAESLRIHVGVDPNGEQVVTVDGVDVSRAIRTPEIDRAVGPVASAAPVRAALVREQRRWAAERGAGVMDGRDISTAVFPDAPVKVYLTASIEERAKRRSLQSGLSVDAVAADIQRRDHLDSNREADPLQIAEGATVVDTTGLTIDEVVDRIVALVPPLEAAPSTSGKPGMLAGSGEPTASAISVNSQEPATSNQLNHRASDAAEALETTRMSRVERMVYGTAWYLARFVTMTFIRTTYLGLENVPKTGAFLVAPNHRSVVDFFLVGPLTRRRLRYLGKDSIWEVKWFVPIANALGGIPVHRGTADRASMTRCIDALRGGEPLVLFPEGTRKAGPVIEELFDGVSYIALKAGVPILPVGIGGSDKVLPKGSFFPRPRRVTVIVGEPMYAPAAGRSARKSAPEMTAQLHARIQSLYDEAQRLTS